MVLPVLKIVKTPSSKGFSLVELLVVMAIMAMLLVMGASLFKNVGSGESREAVRSLVLGGLNNAQTRAVSSGEAVAMVMMPYGEGRVDQLGRAFTIFEVTQDDVTGTFVAGKQLRRWATLPGRFIFSKGSTVSDSGQNAYDQPNVVSVSIRQGEGQGKGSVEMPAIIFGGAGNVIWPSGEAELELHMMEGKIVDGRVTATSVGNDEWQKREVIVIGRQTGRARYLQTQ